MASKRVNPASTSFGASHALRPRTACPADAPAGHPRPRSLPRAGSAPATVRRRTGRTAHAPGSGPQPPPDGPSPGPRRPLPWPRRPRPRSGSGRGLEDEALGQALLARGQGRSPVDVEQAQLGEVRSRRPPGSSSPPARPATSSATTTARSRSTAGWRGSGLARTGGRAPRRTGRAIASSPTRTRSARRSQRREQRPDGARRRGRRGRARRSPARATRPGGPAGVERRAVAVRRPGGRRQAGDSGDELDAARGRRRGRSGRDGRFQAGGTAVAGQEERQPPPLARAPRRPRGVALADLEDGHVAHGRGARSRRGRRAATRPARSGAPSGARRAGW